MVAEFKAKDVETLKTEVLEDLGTEYEGNEEVVDKVVARRLKDEEFKSSVHSQKTKAQEEKDKAKEILKKAGFNPETGEKLESNDPKPASSTSLGMSVMDIRALNKVHDDDVERVEKFAKAEGISIAEALKSEDLQAILKHHDELRKTAAATNTGGSKRSSNSHSAEQIVSAAMEGKEVDPVKFAEAQMELRKKK